MATAIAPEDVEQLWTEFKQDQNNQDMRNRLVEIYLPLVKYNGERIWSRLPEGVELDDLIGEGNIGLIRAVKEYDPRFGTRFSTYASYWIKQAIRHALLNTAATIRLPAHVVGLLTKWRRAERALAREFGYAPTAEQVAVALGLTDSQKSLIEKAQIAGQLRLESNGPDEGGSWSPDHLADPGSPPDAQLEADDERQALERIRTDQEEFARIRSGLLASPQDPGLRSEAARWLMTHGHEEEAIDWAKLVLAAEPSHPAMNRLLADYYRKRGQQGLANFHEAFAPPPSGRPGRTP